MRNRSTGRGQAASAGLDHRQAHGLFVGVESVESIDWARKEVGAASDVRELSAALDPALSTNVRLVNADATREQILAGTEDIVQDAGYGDLVIAYFGGYSQLRYDDVYFMPSDHEPGSFLATSVSFRLLAAVLSSVPGVKTLMILDVCGAGAVGFDMSSYHVGSESGLMVSCGPGELAYSEQRDGVTHGLFTLALVDVLRGAQNGDPEWRITLIDWFDDAYGATKQRYPQHPVFLGTLSPNLELRNADRRRAGTGAQQPRRS